MCIKLTLLMDLEKLVGEEKLAEAEKAVFKAFVDMGERIGTVAYRKPELGLCTIIYRNSIIRLYIKDNGITEIKILHSDNNTNIILEDIIKNVVSTITEALGTDRDKLDAIALLITPLDTTSYLGTS